MTAGECKAKGAAADTEELRPFGQRDSISETYDAGVDIYSLTRKNNEQQYLPCGHIYETSGTQSGAEHEDLGKRDASMFTKVAEYVNPQSEANLACLQAFCVKLEKNKFRSLRGCLTHCYLKHPLVKESDSKAGYIDSEEECDDISIDPNHIHDNVQTWCDRERTRKTDKPQQQPRCGENCYDEIRECEHLKESFVKKDR